MKKNALYQGEMEKAYVLEKEYKAFRQKITILSTRKEHHYR